MYNNFLEIYRRHFDGLRVHNRYDTFPEPEEFFRISKQAYFDTKEEKAVSFLVAALYIAGNSSIISGISFVLPDILPASSGKISGNS